MAENRSLIPALRKTKDGRVVCTACGCLAVTTTGGRWICGGYCQN